MENIIEKVRNFPQAPGVYVFRGAKKEILYIGKATNLRSRVQSYFRGTDSRGERIVSMVSRATDVEFRQTDSVLEALILESNLIKNHQPKYNIMEKDDKSFAYFVITKEEFPRILIVRKTDLNVEHETHNAKREMRNAKNKKAPRSTFHVARTFGPYVSKYQMEIALKIIRRIFPFHSNKAKTEKGCLDFQLGRCPGPYAGAISKEDYKKNIRGIRMILEGKKKRLVTTLEKEMEEAAKKNEFEKAAELRNKIFALNHIRDIALMGREFESEFSDLKPSDYNLKPIRIEAYDISNISGKQAVGSMVVFSGKNPDKSQYRKFKIKSVEGPDDVAMMREVLARRIGNDWPKPELVLLDGGQGHLNMAKDLFGILGFDVPLVAVAKGPTRKNQELRIMNYEKLGSEIRTMLKDENFLKHIMDEAHRFAIGYHRKLRRKDMLE